MADRLLILLQKIVNLRIFITLNNYTLAKLTSYRKFTLQQISPKKDKMTTVEEVLAKERQNIRFNPHKLSEFLYGKQEYAEIKRVLQTNPVTPHDFNLFNKGRVEIIKQSMRDLPMLFKVLKGDLSDANCIYLFLNCMNQTPGSVHAGMFIKCIQILGTDSQHQKYLQKSRNYEMIGCYGQTQMGHGSDVSSLMTTATFDQEKDQFIINNTHDIKAIKYWPGDLGIIATHALVFAQLMIKGKSEGVHPFVVRIRDENMQPLPGVQVGDIGPKIGFHSKDNGYLILKNVAISRKDMLRRYTSVSRTGQIKIKGDPKISYATMMQIRKFISYIFPKIYASAITIAARYSIFRRQFKNSAKEEIQIIDYQLQQEKIFQRVAEYYAISVAGNNIKNLCTQNLRLVKEKNDFSLMNETHACLCLGKPFFSEIIYDGMEICRKACGGHGFSHYSGFPSLINEYASNLTHEGENTVLYLQVARYLLKSYKKHMVKKQPLDYSVKYIESFQHLMSKKCEVREVSHWNLENLRILLAQSVCYMLSVCVEKIMNKEEGFTDKDMINKVVGINLKDLAIMHAGYYTYECFKRAIDEETDEKIKQLTTILCLLFGNNFLLTHLNPAAQGGFITSQQTRSLFESKEILLKKLRPDIIGLVDGFGIPDKYIRSALIYGNPYENFLKLARENELNHQRLQSVDIVRNIKNYLKNPNASL